MDLKLASQFKRLECIAELSRKITQLEKHIREMQQREAYNGDNMAEVLRQEKFGIYITGQRNSGKSSLINELLGHDVLPVSETKLPSRAVRIVYSDRPYIRQLDADGNEVSSSVTNIVKEGIFDVDVVKELVNCEERISNEQALLGNVIEIGLDMSFLRIGIELIDLPSTNSDESLDTILSKLHAKSNMVSLLYVIDGNYSLTMLDKATVQYFKKQFPQVDIFYLCNKLDVDREAMEMDLPSDDEDTDEEFGAPTSEGKSKKVLDSLLENNYLTEEDKVKRYIGLSLTEVKKSRLENKVQSTGYFNDFLCTLAEYLKPVIEQKLLNVLNDIKTKIMNISRITKRPRLNRRESITLSDVSNRLKHISKQLCADLEKHFESQRQSFNDLFFEILKYIYATTKSKVPNVCRNLDESENITGHSNSLSAIQDRLTARHTDESKPNIKKISRYIKICYEFRSIILNGIITKLKYYVQQSQDATLREIASRQALANAEAFGGSVITKHEMATQCELFKFGSPITSIVVNSISEKLHLLYNDLFLLELVRPVAEQSSHSSPKEKEAYVLFETMFPHLDAIKVSEDTIDVCKKEMRNRRDLCLIRLSGLNTKRTSQDIEKLVQSAYFEETLLPQLAYLEVQQRSISYEIRNGSMQFGSELCRGQHTRIHQYMGGWDLSNAEDYVVRVVEGEDRMDAVVLNLYHASSFAQHDNLLKIMGWLKPSPSKLHIVVQKMKSSLITAIITPEHRLQISRDVAIGMKEIHDNGYTFNNLEPKNVLITDDHRAVINICKGNYDESNSDKIRTEICKFGELLLCLYDCSEEGTRPIDCDLRIWDIIQKCTERHYKSFDDVISSLKASDQN
ncbi:uncharacterized protein LOC144360331 [Saccoglossus kowalevskii]